jgi:hypothetical protein
MSVMMLCFNYATHSAVIPGPAEGRSPESITTAQEYGFRARRFAAPRNDAEARGSVHTTT